jgi:adenosylcobinamide-GDP ribazoletransferase
MSDMLPTEEQETVRFRPVAEILVSLRFLTRVPVPFERTVDPVPLALAMRAFPLAGAAIGAANALVLEGLARLHLPGLMVAAMTLAFGLFITGALHEDGLADTADGLLGGSTRERRLEIMRDSRIGSYGASALILAFLMKASAYEALLALPFWQVVLILAATGAFSRTMVVDMMWATRPARSDGLAALAGRPSRNTDLFAIVTGGAIAVLAGWAIDPISGVVAMGVALMITGLMRRLATRLVGGQTGDICGAVQVLAEIGMLVSYLASNY